MEQTVMQEGFCATWHAGHGEGVSCVVVQGEEGRLYVSWCEAGVGLSVMQHGA